MVLEEDHCVVDQRRKLQVVVRDVQLSRLSELLVLPGQYARDGHPGGVEHRTLSQIVQHMVIRSLCLLGTQLAEVIHMVCQSLQRQFAMQLFEPVAPLLHRLVRLPVHVLLLDHQVSCRLHREDADATAQAIVDISKGELLIEANLRTRGDAVPVDGQDVVDAVVVGIIHTRQLIVESLQFQIVLAYPGATALCRDAAVQLRVEHIQVHGHHLAIHHFLRPLESSEEDVVRRLGGQITNHTLWLHQRLLLLCLRTRSTFLLLLLVARLLCSHLIVLLAHHAHNLVVQVLGKALTRCRLTDNQHLRVQSLFGTIEVFVPASCQQRAIHRSRGKDSPQPVRPVYLPTGFGIRSAKERFQPLSVLLVRDVSACHRSLSCC